MSRLIGIELSWAALSGKHSETQISVQAVFQGAVMGNDSRKEWGQQEWTGEGGSGITVIRLQLISGLAAIGSSEARFTIQGYFDLKEGI